MGKEIRKEVGFVCLGLIKRQNMKRVRVEGVKGVIKVKSHKENINLSCYTYKNLKSWNIFLIKIRV